MLGYFRQNLTGYLKNNIVAYFFTILVFILGIVIGALAIKTLPDEQKMELMSYLKIFFQGLTQGTGNIDNASIFGSVVFNNIKTIGLIWLLGFTIVGIPFVLFIIFIRGFVIGFTVGFLVNEYIMRGLAFALASVLPHNIFAVPALITAGVAAISFSFMLARRKSRGKSNLFYESIAYSLLCLIMLVFMIVAAVMEVYVSPVFMKTIAGLLLHE